MEKQVLAEATITNSFENQRLPLKNIKFPKNSTPEEREAQICKQMDKIRKRYIKLQRKIKKKRK